MKERQSFQFCTLAYRPQNSHGGPLPAEAVILLVLKDRSDCLHFRVSPKLQQIVRGDDLEYILSLLPDFVIRSKQQPAALFRQLCSLGVGPLVVHEVGTKFTEHPGVAELSSQFVDL
jgi:hypothetical protein